MKFKNNNFKLIDDISDFSIKDTITLKVKEFYEKFPFPNYKIDDNKYTISEIGNKNMYSNRLKKFIGSKKTILEVGAGTSQLSNYLAIGNNNKVCAFDTSMSSLKLGKKFAKQNKIKNISFVRGDIFDEIFEENVFDFVLCNGVLHHTKNPSLAFSNISKCLKKEGYILVGLYNKIGRVRTKIRKVLYKIFGRKIVMIMDPVLRKIGNKSKDKTEAWIRDQYEHPVETTHTFDEVLDWFKKNNIEFIDSIPNCSISNELKNNFLEETNKGTYLERIFQQFFMILSQFGSEGGLFIFVGRKK